MTDEAVMELLGDFELNAGASSDGIRQVERHLGAELPGEYRDLLQRANGGEGPLGQQSYLVLWPVDELVDRNEGYKVDDQYASSLILFGTDGGNEAFAVRTTDGCYVAAPLIGMSEDAVRGRGRTLREFLASFL